MKERQFISKCSENLNEFNKLSLENFPAASNFSENEEDQYITKVILGNGSLGSVFHVESPKFPRRYFAKKCVQLNTPEKIQRAQTELSILYKLNTVYDLRVNKNRRPVTAKLHDVFLTADSWTAVLTFALHGDLATYLKYKPAISRDSLLFIASQLIVAIEFLHNNDILHRDIKPENILVDSKRHILLTDFDMSVDMKKNPEQATGLCGTLEYMAPEVASSSINKSASLTNPASFPTTTCSNYGYPIDIFSLGMTLLSFVCAMKEAFRCPCQHDGLPDGELERLVSMGRYHLSGIAAKNKEIRQLFTGMLAKNPEKRFSVDQIKQSAAFATIKFDKIERGEMKMGNF